MKFSVGDLINRKWRLERFLDRGTSGIVFYAKDELQDFREGKVKIIVARKETFERERILLTRVRDVPHVEEIFEANYTDDSMEFPYYAAQYVDGTTFDRWMAGKSQEAILRIIIQYAEGLKGIHAKGVTHNDVKPTNLLVDKDNYAWLTDFGISFSDSLIWNRMRGAKTYAPPEKFNNPESADPRVDVYALGAVLYEALTGRAPLEADSLEELIEKVRHEVPVRPGISEDIDRIVMKCLEKEAEKRFRDGEELFWHLDGAVNKRIVYVVEKYKEVEAEDEERFGAFFENLSRSIIQNKIKNWIFPLDKCPYVIGPGSERWFLTEKNFWTAGKIDSIYMTGFKITKEEKFLELIEKRAEKFNLRELPRHANAIGSIFYDVFVPLFEATGKDEYKEKALEAARFLCEFYKEPGFIQISSNERTINRIFTGFLQGGLPLLWWAAKNNKTSLFYKIATEHTDKTLRYCIRKDGSVREAYDLNLQKSIGLQGYESQDNESHHAISQARAICGFTLAYENTKDKEFLKIAEKVADYFIRNLPKDLVPFYDFEDPNIPNVPKDSAAAAVGALSLLMLSKVHPDRCKAKRLRQKGNQITLSLTKNYLCFNEPIQGLLKHGCSDYRQSYHIDSFLIYGDEAYLKSLELIKK
ncbi:MAG: serine/threonine protein kinase [Nanoarchaeota archaeon]|nr:serine/threonine protein kinase [Nanoarchaeota archaeon]